MAPKLLTSMEAAESGSRRAVERGSDAAETDKGSCRGSPVGGAAEVSFDPLSFFPFLAVAVSTDCRGDTRVLREYHYSNQLTVTMPISG